MGLKMFGFSCVLAATLLAGVAVAQEAATPAESPAKAAAVAGEADKAVTAHESHKEAKEEKDFVHEQIDPKTVGTTIAIFVCLLIVLRFTAWKPIMAGLQSRERAIRDSIEAAERAKADAERTTRDLEAKMGEVQRAAAQQLAQAKADAVKVADTIRAQAEAESAALKDRTVREIDAAKQQALSEINAHAATLGTSVAKKILQREVNAGDQQRLVEESLAEMAKKN